MERRLAAILCADVYGYSRLMGQDEEATLRALTSHRKIIDSQIERHRGRFVNSAGDSVLAEYPSVVEAVGCAVDIQRALELENRASPPERRMLFRIGVNLGDVIAEGNQIYGDGINVAARLESLADPGGICVSATVRDHIKNKLALGYEDLGRKSVKNIAEPVHVWRVLPHEAAGQRRARLTPRKYWRRGVLSLAGAGILAAVFVLARHVSLEPTKTHASIPPRQKPAPPLPSIPSIAVLPFANLSGDQNQEYFSDGIGEQLINHLSRLPGLFVIARNSSFSFKRKTVGEREIGRELGVKYILEGSVAKSPQQVRIGVELVDASSATEIWTENYDRPLKDIFAVQDEIVRRVMTTLRLILALQRYPLGTFGDPTENEDAFDCYLRADAYYWRLTKDDDQKAGQWLEKAITLDSKFADAYALLGVIDMNAVLFEWSKDLHKLEDAAELARKALSLDDSNALALVVLCDVDWLRRQYERAIAEGRRAVEIAPNWADAYVALSNAYTVSNRPADAVAAAEKATRLDPAAADFNVYFIAAPYVLMGRYEEAIPLLKRHLAAFPEHVWGHVALASHT